LTLTTPPLGVIYHSWAGTRHSHFVNQILHV